MNKPIVLVTGIGPSPTSIRPIKAKEHLIRVAVDVFISFCHITIQREALKALSRRRGLGEGDQK